MSSHNTASCQLIRLCLLAAVVEVHDGSFGHDAPFIGACALDTAAAQIMLGSWRDDEVLLVDLQRITGLTEQKLEPLPAFSQ